MSRRRLQLEGEGGKEERRAHLDHSFSDTTLHPPPSLLPPKKYCDITGLVAPYRDPKTTLQFHSKEVYEVLKTLVSFPSPSLLSSRPLGSKERKAEPAPFRSFSLRLASWSRPSVPRYPRERNGHSLSSASIPSSHRPSLANDTHLPARPYLPLTTLTNLTTTTKFPARLGFDVGMEKAHQVLLVESSRPSYL